MASRKKKIYIYYRFNWDHFLCIYIDRWSIGFRTAAPFLGTFWRCLLIAIIMWWLEINNITLSIKKRMIGEHKITYNLALWDWNNSSFLASPASSYLKTKFSDNHWSQLLHSNTYLVDTIIQHVSIKNYLYCITPSSLLKGWWDSISYSFPGFLLQLSV